MAQVYSQDGALLPDLWACEYCLRVFQYSSKEKDDVAKAEYRRTFGEEPDADNAVQVCDACYEHAMRMNKGKETAQ